MKKTISLLSLILSAVALSSCGLLPASSSQKPSSAPATETTNTEPATSVPTSEEDVPTVGAMIYTIHYDERNNPYYSVRAIHKNLTGKIVIPDKYQNAPVKEIEQEGFRGCMQMSGIVIPDSVVKIGDLAFWSCKNLETVVIPDSIEEVGVDVFDSSVIKTNDDGDLQYIGNPANPYSFLLKCESRKRLENPIITLKRGCRIVGPEVFYHSDKLQEITIPDSVVFIGNSAFQECGNLTHVYGMKNVRGIADNAFENCAEMVSIGEPESIETIGKWSFNSCKKLKELPLSDNFRFMGNFALDECDELSFTTSDNISYLGNETNRFVYIHKAIDNDRTSLTLPMGCKVIGAEAFNGFAHLVHVEFPNGLASIEEYAFAGCSALEEIDLFKTNVSYMGNYAFTGCRKITSFKFSPGLLEIPEGCCEGCWNLVNLQLPGRVRTIGDKGFSACRSLSSVNTKSSLTRLGTWAFANCNISSIELRGILYYGECVFEDCPITSVTLDFDLKEFYGNVFNGCPLESLDVEKITGYRGNYYSPEGSNLIVETKTNTAIAGCKNSVIPDTITAIGPYAFYRVWDLTSINIPSSVTTIGNYAFSVTRIESIDLPSSIIEIGDCAFYSCPYLETVHLHEGLIKIGESAFQDCSLLNSIEIPSSVLYICDDAFKNSGITDTYCNIDSITDWLKTEGTAELEGTIHLMKDGVEIHEAVIGEEITYLKSYAFARCVSLASITIPNSVTTIYQYVFDGCTGLTSISIPSSVEEIGSCCFENCVSLSQAIIKAKITEIGYGLFDHCTSLESVVVPDEITKIGDRAFFDCDALSKVFYMGTAESWSGIEIGKKNEKLTAATRYYYSESRPSTAGKYWHYVNDVPTAW